MPYACKFCIAFRGIRGSEIATLPQTEEELFDHIEKEHGIIVRRKGETEEEARARYEHNRQKDGKPTP